MIDIKVIYKDFISIKTNNLRKVLFNELNYFFSNFDVCYLQVSHREYNKDFDIKEHKLIKKESDESFIFEIALKNNYSQIIDELTNLFDEFQYFILVFQKDLDLDFGDFDSIRENRYIFFKSIERDVIWIKGKNVTNLIK